MTLKQARKDAQDMANLTKHAQVVFKTRHAVTGKIEVFTGFKSSVENHNLYTKEHNLDSSYYWEVVETFTPQIEENHG